MLAVALLLPHSITSEEVNVDQLKARISSTSISGRPRLCIEIAQKQLEETDKLYASADLDKAQASLTDVVTYSELARDYAIQSHKYEKQSEIAVRGMTRKLNELLHSLGQEEQPPIKDALTRLQHVRDDLLSAMFKRGDK